MLFIAIDDKIMPWFLTPQAAESWMPFWAKRSPTSKGIQSVCVLEWHFSTEVIDFTPGEVMVFISQLKQIKFFVSILALISPIPPVAVQR